MRWLTCREGGEGNQGAYQREPGKMLSERDPHPPRKHVEGGKEGCRVSSYWPATQPNRPTPSRTVSAKYLNFARLILDGNAVALLLTDKNGLCFCRCRWLSVPLLASSPFWASSPLARQRSGRCLPCLACPLHADQALSVLR